MQEVNFDEVLDKVLAADTRYHRDAYVFLKEALDHTQKLVSKENRGITRHVTPAELLNGIREFALTQFGPMAITVLEEWGIRHCSDFGELVFNLIEANLLKKTERDSREDFQTGYDFTDAFVKPFWPPSRLAETAPRPVSRSAS